MHSHLGPGWQDMSPPDYLAESNHAAATLASTLLPLVGLTIATDGSWSARFWERIAPKRYIPRWCSTVRVVGKGLKVTFHPKLVRTYTYREQHKRTVSFWGGDAQRHLARIHVGIIGLGSVGSLVNECLARIGIRHITLLDFDRAKIHNLDRTAGATLADAAQRMFKVKIASRLAESCATAEGFDVTPLPLSIVEPKGYNAALDCDVLFSCVDRPWARRVLNHIAYAHLIPVVDGGIIARIQKGKFKNAYWSIRIAGPQRACLECTGAYDSGLVSVDREGHLDDPHYIEGLPEESPLRRNENIFPLSMSLAAHEVLQFVALTTGLVGMHEVGEQRFSYFPGFVESHEVHCDTKCPFPALVALGEKADRQVGEITGTHSAAEIERMGKKQRD